jgi:hypothetical protein
MGRVNTETGCHRHRLVYRRLAYSPSNPSASPPPRCRDELLSQVTVPSEPSTCSSSMFHPIRRNGKE